MKVKVDRDKKVSGYPELICERDGHSVVVLVMFSAGSSDDLIAATKNAIKEADRAISFKTHRDVSHCEDPSANLPDSAIAWARSA